MTDEYNINKLYLVIYSKLILTYYYYEFIYISDLVYIFSACGGYFSASYLI